MDGTKRRLIIRQALAQSKYHEGGSSSIDDEFMIEYGNPEDSGGLIKYPIPELGESKNDHNHIVKDLSINNILINIIINIS